MVSPRDMHDLQIWWFCANRETIDRWINDCFTLRHAHGVNQACYYSDIFLSTRNSCLWLEQSWSAIILYILNNHCKPHFWLKIACTWTILPYCWKWPVSLSTGNSCLGLLNPAWTAHNVCTQIPPYHMGAITNTTGYTSMAGKEFYAGLFLEGGNLYHAVASIPN